MFYSDFYAARIAAIDAEIRRKQRVAALIFSESKACQRRANAAIRRIEKLREELTALEAIARQEAAQGA